MSQEPKEKHVEHRNTLQILEDTATRFNALGNEADLALADRDAKGCREILVKRAQLIADLPNQLSQATDIQTHSDRDEILQQVTSFSDSAKEALELGGDFRLGVLLTPRGSKQGDPNLLEALVESIKK